VTAAVLPAPPRRAEAEKRLPVDYVGTVLLGTAITCVVLLATWGGSIFPWDSAAVRGLGLGSLVLFLAFCLTELRAKDPLIPPPMFKDLTFDLASGTSFIIGFGMFGVISFLPVFLQVASRATASILSGQAVSRTGRYKVFPVCGTVIATIGMFLLSRMTPDTTRATSSAYMAVAGAGLGLTMQVMVVAMQNSIAREYLGVATSTVSFFRSVGGSFGVAVFGAVFNGRLGAELARRSTGNLLEGHATERAGGLLRTLENLPPGPRRELAAAFAHALTGTFLVAVPCTAVAIALAMLLPEKPLRGREQPQEAVTGAA
jgi:hypothetical protein